MAGQIPTQGVKPKGTTTSRKPAAKRTASKAVAKPAEKSDFTKAQATKLTEKIKKGAETTFEDIKKAFLGRIWLALGHKSWDEYLDAHYEGVPLALPREKKKEAVQSLTAAGMSSRAIAAATGISQSTAARQGKKVADPKPSGESSDSGDSNVIDIDPKDITEVKDGDGLDEFKGEERRQGADGKSYPASQPAREPVVVEIVSAAKAIAKDLDSVRIRLDSLFSRDDYEAEKVKVQEALVTSVGDIFDTLFEEFTDLVTERAPQVEPEPV